MSAVRAVLARELALAFRSGGGAGLGLAFFLIVVLLVPLGVGPDPERLAGLAAGTLWIGALLACLLSLDRLFQADAEDGTLDILALSPLPLEALVALKAAAHWLTTGLPLVVAAPLLALTLHLPAPAYPWLAASLAAGTPGLSLLGAIGAARHRRHPPRRPPPLAPRAAALPADADLRRPRRRRRRRRPPTPGPPSSSSLGLTLFILALAPFAAAAALRANLR